METPRLITLSESDLKDYGCCGFKKPAKSEGFQLKRAWTAQQIKQGLKFKVLQSPSLGTIGFIEYIPGEFCWRAIDAREYMVIHCIMSYAKDLQHQGYGKMLIDACYDDAVAAGMAGVAVVASGDSFMADKEIFTKNGFVAIEKAPPKFELLVKKIRKDAPNPLFKGDWDSKAEKHSYGISIYYSNQCPMTSKWVNEMIEYTSKNKISTSVFEITDHVAAQECPSPYGTFALIYNGKILASRPVSGGSFTITMNKLLKK